MHGENMTLDQRVKEVVTWAVQAEGKERLYRFLVS